MLYLSKLASSFSTPLGVCIVLCIVGLLLHAFRRRRAGIAMVTVAVVLLWMASTPLAARMTLGSLERLHPPPALDDIASADVAIVLGGAVGGAVPPLRGPDLGDAADRVLHALDLFRAGKVRAILISGGNLPWSTEAEPEAEAIRKLLVGWGVPEDAILTEGRSRTTAENAREVASLWPTLGFSSSLLVTSGFHMPRALATFRKAGLPVTPAATDVRAVDGPFQVLDLLPDAGSLASTSTAMKEAAGYLVYRVRGDL